MKTTLQRPQIAKLLRSLARMRRRLATEGGSVGVQVAAGLDMAIAEVRVELGVQRHTEHYVARMLRERRP